MDTPQLVRMRYELFPLGSVQPNGWIQDQLRLCAAGLGGSLFYFYRFVKDSTWLGGTWEYSALNEAAPYWYNYIVPLAYSVDQQADGDLANELKKQAEHFLNYTLDNQSADGWLGPETTRQTRGIWARCLLLQGLRSHAEADSAKRTAVIQAILKFVRLVHKMLSSDYEGYLPSDGDKFDPQWFGVARAHELSTTLQWIYDVEEASDDRRTIWEVMEMLWEGSRIAKRDWTVFFQEDNFPSSPSVRHKSLNFQHGVNVAQGLRYPPQLYRMHPSDELSQLSKHAVERAFASHGTPSGSLSSDEYIGGLSPQRGSELCCSVELVFTLAYMHRLFGDNMLADRVELAAFNAIPAGISSDWWSHQYVTQANQPWARELILEKDEKTPFYDVCRYANVFGLEPEFPCCTVNHPTAYPKLLMNAFVQVTADKDGDMPPAILHAYLLPSRLSIGGTTIFCETNYPFVPCALSYSISADKPFEFLIRVPGWASASSSIEFAEAQSNDVLHSGPFVSNSPDNDSGLHRIQVPSSGNYTVAVTICSEVSVKSHQNDSISISYGPLLFAYEVAFEETTRLPRNYKDQVSDCSELVNVEGQEAWKSQVRDHEYLPTSKWNIGIDPSKEIKVISEDPWLDRKERRIRGLPEPVWKAGSSPVNLEATAVEIEWPVSNGTAADPKDVDKGAVGMRGEPFRTRLVPYGTAKLHIAQFPKVSL